jgi:excisionase family DNA binding protein
MTSDAPKFIDVRAAAALLNVHESTIRAAFKAGTLPGIRLGRSIRFSLQVISTLGLQSRKGDINHGKS